MDFDSKEFAAAFHYDGNDLGAVYTKEKTVFKVWAPTASGVRVNLYRTGSDIEEGASLLGVRELCKGRCGVFSVEEPGDCKGIYYTYTINADGNSVETPDIYARACGVNGRRSMVVSLPDTDPEGFREDNEFLAVRRRNASCPIIYELHIKDFSSSIHCRIQDDYRGKYLAFTQEGTTLDDNGVDATGIDYLKQLGITHVHLLPFFDYGSVDETGDLDVQFNWGYDPVNYNVPEGSYSTDPFCGEVRIRECKQMIQAIHQAGISVVMDVVYNHTYSMESAFNYTVPGYYYRKNADGEPANGSLCGNDTASERSMYRSYMIHSVLYWAREYQIDGFRFDLMGLHDVETMNRIRNELNTVVGGTDILMYGEPWSGDYSPMQQGAVPALKENIHQLHERIGMFCDNTRDAIKGNVFIAEEAGFINGEPGLEEEIKGAVCAWQDNKSPQFSPRHSRQIISYVSAHDNYTLWDKLIYTLPEHSGKKVGELVFDKKESRALRQNMLAAGIYFTCLGMVFFQAGEEFARSKQGVDNSFDAPVWLNMLKWEQIKEYKELMEYYRGLIAFRKQMASFYGTEARGVNIVFQDVDIPGIVAFEVTGSEQPGVLFIVYNANQEKTILSLPEGAWKMISDGRKVFCRGKQKAEYKGQVIVNYQAAMIFEKGV